MAKPAGIAVTRSSALGPGDGRATASVKLAGWPSSVWSNLVHSGPVWSGLVRSGPVWSGLV